MAMKGSPSPHTTPHSLIPRQVLHVREVFTTEQFLNIITPDEEEGAVASEGGTAVGHTGGVWAIPPKQEKEIVKLSFR